MNDVSPSIEIIDFRQFPKKLLSGAIGMVFGKINHGMTTNFFSELVYPFHLDEKGVPKISLDFAIAAIKYSVASEISVALNFLQGQGWLDQKLTFVTSGLEPFEEISVDGWDEHWSDMTKVDLAYYLEDVCKELEYSDKAFSQEWYYAKVSNLYFSEIEIPDIAMTVGILLSQLWWKMDLEKSAVRGVANTTSLEKANAVRKRLSKKQSEAKDKLIVQYWREALKEFGAEAMRRDSNAAQAIYAIASNKRPSALTIKSTGETIGPDAIRKRLSTLRKQEKLG